MLIAGCHRLPESETVAEINEPAYEEGKRLLRQGRKQAALMAFSQVIESRRDGAPESHLEVGLLFQLEIKDPVAAIYHFRRYLELKPNSSRTDLVRERIDASTREFARTLPAQPLENLALRNDYLDMVQDLRRENARLKEELAGLREDAISIPRGMVPDRSQASSLSPRRTPVATPSPITPVPMAEAGERPGSRSPSAGTRNADRGGAARTHTVVKGDTLYGLARKYYGNSARSKDIFAANRHRMKSQHDLQLGMELVIPR